MSGLRRRGRLENRGRVRVSMTFSVASEAALAVVVARKAIEIALPPA